MTNRDVKATLVAIVCIPLGVVVFDAGVPLVAGMFHGVSIIVFGSFILRWLKC